MTCDNMFHEDFHLLLKDPEEANLIKGRATNAVNG